MAQSSEGPYRVLPGATEGQRSTRQICRFGRKHPHQHPNASELSQHRRFGGRTAHFKGLPQAGSGGI